MQIKERNALEGLRAADFAEIRCLKQPPTAMVSLFAMILYFHYQDKTRFKDFKRDFDNHTQVWKLASITFM